MFYPDMKIEVPGYGDKDSKVTIVGDFTDGFDMKARRPFSGYGGTILESCLHNAGMIRGEVYLTNVVKTRDANPLKYYNKNTGKFTEEGMGYVRLLQAELSEVESNIIVASGDAAFSALCSLRHLSSYRGYIFPSTLLPGRKVIPIHHPRSAFRGNYVYRYMIASDLTKAKGEADYPEIRRPDRKLVYLHDTCYDAMQWLDYFTDQKIVGFDIEVLNYEVSCISFSSSPDLSVVIPIAGRWTLDEEMQIWRGLQQVLGNPESKKIIQNGMFDIPFLLTRNGVVVRGEIRDTMVAHSVVFPDLPKALGFLGSIYCGSQEYWKDTVKFHNIKDES